MKVEVDKMSFGNNKHPFNYNYFKQYLFEANFLQ